MRRSWARRTASTLTRQQFAQELDLLPTFRTTADRVDVLRDPTQFHSWLLKRIATAKRRIFFAALYLGKEQQALVDAIHQALARNPSLEFYYVGDYFRSTREAPHGTCSADLLASLKANFKDRVFASLYHTPELTGLVKRLVPRRFDEGWGLWHSKIYGIDDDVLMSGANLSTDYFTNRQDRYMVFRDQAKLADYLHKFLLVGQSISYAITANSSTPSWAPSNLVPEPLASNKAEHKARSAELLKKLQADARAEQDPFSPSPVEIRPFIQAGHLGVRQESDYVVPYLLSLGPEQGVGCLDWTSGYFSLDAANQRRLLETRVDQIRVVCASPEANGFFQSAGVSKHIPPAYTLAERCFFNAARRKQLQNVQLCEWKRSGWTYHAKGIWLSGRTTPHRPFATVIGSSNYGPRSATRDMELSVLLSTTDASLQARLGEEVEHIRQFADEVDGGTFERPERRVGWGVRLAAWAIRDML